MSVTEHDAPQHYQLKHVYTCPCVFNILTLFEKKKQLCMIEIKNGIRIKVKVDYFLFDPERKKFFKRVIKCT